MSFDSETREHRRIQRCHAISACATRYGISLTDRDYSMICDRVWAFVYGSGDADVKRAGRERYFVRYKEWLMLVAWSPVTLQIATFLPRWSDLTERETNEKTRQWIAARVASGQETAEAN